MASKLSSFLAAFPDPAEGSVLLIFNPESLLSRFLLHSALEREFAALTESFSSVIISGLGGSLAGGCSVGCRHFM